MNCTEVLSKSENIFSSFPFPGWGNEVFWFSSFAVSFFLACYRKAPALILLLKVPCSWLYAAVLHCQIRSSKTSKEGFYRRIKGAYSPWPERGTILLMEGIFALRGKGRGCFGLGTLLWVFKIFLNLNPFLLIHHSLVSVRRGPCFCGRQ